MRWGPVGRLVYADACKLIFAERDLRVFQRLVVFWPTRLLLEMRRRIEYAQFVILLWTFSACGGGGDGGVTPPPPPPAAVATVEIGGNSAASLAGGETRILTATLRDASGNVLTGRSVSWQSSSNAVATVASGVVTGVGQGTATITAISEGTSGTTDVNVVFVPAAIQITRSSSFLITGDTLQVGARVVDDGGRVVPDQDVTFSIDNEMIASAETSGLMTALGPGLATVTASAGSITETFSLTIHPGGGTRIAPLSVIDSIIIAEKTRLNVPAVSIAIAHNGALVYARSYGYADTTTKRVAEPEQMYRVGSVSKVLTAAAVMKLVQEGQLSLDAKPFVMLDNIQPRAGYGEDPRLVNVTVRDLLQHSAGWHENRAVDDTVYAALWRDLIFDNVEIARYGRSVLLANDPGTRFAYTNYGYQALGRLIEKVTGQSYEAYVKSAILDPAGIVSMKLGRTPLAERDPLEVSCYDGGPVTTGIYGTGKYCDVTPVQEYAEASGAWVASATEMVRWLSVVDGYPGARADVLSAATLTEMTARPEAIFPGSGYYYALGWEVDGSAGDQWWQHAGAQSGGDGYMARMRDGVLLTILTNRSRPSAVEDLLDRKIRPLVASITAWPAGTPF